MGEITVTVPRLRLIAGRYFWRPTAAVQKLGFAAEALGADPAAAIIRAREINEEVALARQQPGASIVRAGSVAALIAAYKLDDVYRTKAESTRNGYDWLLAQIEKRAGKVMVSTITRKELKDTYREASTRGSHYASALMRMWSVLMSFAQEEGMIAVSPARRMRLRTPKSRQQTWTPEQVQAFCEAAVKLERPSMALAARLLYDSSQRPGDILRLPRSAQDGDTIALRQRKTGRLVKVVLSAETVALIAAAPAPVESLLILNNEVTGRPYKIHHFQHEFARIRVEAKLPMDLQARDLRRTALTEAGAGGATVAELQAMGGHSTMAMLPRYVLPTDEGARSAAQKRAKMAKPPK